MQEATFKDVDGVTRKYGYDDFDGQLYLRVGEGLRGEYRKLAHIDSLRTAKNADAHGVVNAARYADVRGIQGAHAALWSDPSEAAERIGKLAAA